MFISFSTTPSISRLLPTVGSIDNHVGRASLDLVMVLDFLTLNFMDASEIIRYHQSLVWIWYFVRSSKLDDHLPSGMEGNRIGSLY